MKDMGTSLKNAKKQKAEFISMITHELKTPLTPIIGFTQALLDREILGPLSPKQLDAVETISKNANHLQSIIGDLLDSHRLDFNKIKFNYTKVDVADLTNSVIKNFKKEIESKKIQFNVDAKPPMLITTDKQRVEQVLTNIVVNSIDFVPKDTGEISVSAKLEKDHVLFTIQDNGTGIPPEDIDKIFDSFSQIETKLTRKHGGAGLGLAICRALVTKLGGKIWVESKLGKGTSFYFTIAQKPEQMDKSD
jgi:signal transduction histidine kinase